MPSFPSLMPGGQYIYDDNFPPVMAMETDLDSIINLAHFVSMIATRGFVMKDSGS